MLSVIVSAKAANLNQSSQLWLKLISKTGASSKITNVIIVPSHGVNDKGETVQTLELTGVFTAGIDNEVLRFEVQDKSGKKIRALTGIIQLTKSQLTPLTDPDDGANIVAKKAKTVGKKVATVVKKAAKKVTTPVKKATSAAKKVTPKSKK
jgi:hypothetical protein